MLSWTHPYICSFLLGFAHCFCKCQLYIRCCARYFGGNKNEWIPALSNSPSRVRRQIRKRLRNSVLCCKRMHKVLSKGRDEGLAGKGHVARSWLQARQDKGVESITDRSSEGQVLEAQQHVARSRCWWQEYSVGASGQKWPWQIWEPGSHGPWLLCQGVCPLCPVSGKSTWSFKHRCEQTWVPECSGSSEGCWRQTGQNVGMFSAKGDKAIGRSWRCFQSCFPWVFCAVVYM